MSHSVIKKEVSRVKILGDIITLLRLFCLEAVLAGGHFTGNFTFSGGMQIIVIQCAMSVMVHLSGYQTLRGSADNNAVVDEGSTGIRLCVALLTTLM